MASLQNSPSVYHTLSPYSLPQVLPFSDSLYISNTCRCECLNFIRKTDVTLWVSRLCVQVGGAQKNHGMLSFCRRGLSFLVRAEQSSPNSTSLSQGEFSSLFFFIFFSIYLLKFLYNEQCRCTWLS
jgi:photosystem II oxygen-evolving enhancer protein 2